MLIKVSGPMFAEYVDRFLFHVKFVGSREELIKLRPSLIMIQRQSCGQRLHMAYECLDAYTKKLNEFHEKVQDKVLWADVRNPSAQPSSSRNSFKEKTRLLGESMGY